MSLSSVAAGDKTRLYKAGFFILGLTLSLSLMMVIRSQYLRAPRHDSDDLEMNKIDVVKDNDGFSKDVSGSLKNLYLLTQMNEKTLNFINENVVNIDKTTNELKGELSELQGSMDGLSEKVDVLKKDSKKSDKKKFYVLTSEWGYYWHTAMDECKAMNMSLASINSQQEQDDVVEAIEAADNESFHWIAGTYNDSLAAFVWMPSGNRLTFTDWQRGQPTLEDNTMKEDCIRIERTYNFQWNDVPCHSPGSAICEYYESS